MTAAPDVAAIERFRALIARHLGLAFDDDKRGFLADILARHTTAAWLDVARYLERLADADGAAKDWRTLAQALTVTETYFFRNAAQFAALREAVLTEWAGKRVSILSAGCASGEEPYSIAMTLEGAGAVDPGGRRQPRDAGKGRRAAAIRRGRCARRRPARALVPPPTAASSCSIPRSAARSRSRSATWSTATRRFGGRHVRRRVLPQRHHVLHAGGTRARSSRASRARWCRAATCSSATPRRCAACRATSTCATRTARSTTSASERLEPADADAAPRLTCDSAPLPADGPAEAGRLGRGDPDAAAARSREHRRRGRDAARPRPRRSRCRTSAHAVALFGRRSASPRRSTCSHALPPDAARDPRRAAAARRAAHARGAARRGRARVRRAARRSTS